MNYSLRTDAIWLIIADGDDNGDSDTMYTLWSFGFVVCWLVEKQVQVAL